MKRLLILALLLIAAPVVSVCQTFGQTPPSSPLKETSIENVPLIDTLTEAKQKTQTVKQVKSDDEQESRFWASAEYLLWKMKQSNLPPLITTGPENGDARIGQHGTEIVFGGNKLDRGKFPGGRFTAGVWLNEKRDVGVELSYFFLKERTFSFQVSSSGQPGSQVIARPYFDVIRDREFENLVAYPQARMSGSSAAETPSRLQGGEANFIYSLDMNHCCRTSLLAGFRYMDFNERLSIADTFDSFGGRHVEETDQFSTRNQFYGGQAGVRSAINHGRLSLELSGALALGNNRESVEINGATLERFGTRSSISRGGVLALISNIGRYQRNEFTIVPEAKAKLGFDITRAIRAFVGYNLLYWNKVVRPGEQIDRVANPLLIPLAGGQTSGSPLRPAFTFHSTGFWAQGLTTGVKVRF